MTKTIHTNQEIIAMLTEQSLDTGYYRGTDGKVRFLTDVCRLDTEEDSPLFVGYLDSKSIKTYRKGKGVNKTYVNATISKVLDWFQKAKFIGFEVSDTELSV